MQATILTLVYSGLIVAGSLLGGWLPSRWTISHTRMQLILSFVGGLMLGIALLHLLPEGIAEAGPNVALGATLIGLLFMFFLIRTFHFHQHGPAESHDDALADCEHDHSHAHHHVHHGGPHELSWAGVATGLSVHTLIDGIALGAAVQADAHAGGAPLWGVGTFLAILLHKPLDAMSITSLMKTSGWSNAARTAVNVGFSLMCPLGALLVVLGAQHLDTFQAKMLGMLLGFSAGVFLCISLSDLLPEVQFHRHDRFKLSAALLLGVVIAYGVGFLEPAHSHDVPKSITQVELQTRTDGKELHRMICIDFNTKTPSEFHTGPSELHFNQLVTD